MANIPYKKYPKEIREYIVYNGDSLPEFYGPAEGGHRGAEFYIKLYTLLTDHYFTHDASVNPFYVSTTGILGIFNKTVKKDDEGNIIKVEGYGNTYCPKTVRRALNRLLRLKLIAYQTAPKKSDREFPDEFIPHRIIYVDMEAAKELFNVYEPTSDRFIKDYAMKLAVDEIDADKSLSEEEKGERLNTLFTTFTKWLKKIAQKRPYNYTERANEKYLEYKEEGIHRGKYNTPQEMISYYQYHVVSRYTKKTVFTKYLPTHLKDKQKEADRLARSKARPRSLTGEDIAYIGTLEPDKQRAYVEKLIGCTVPEELIYQAKSSCILSGNQIIGYRADDNGGFKEL